ncbi:retropepsin-like aspartic protease family protein [Pseudomonas neustonica]|jgi:aspartyl protease family protein|uniref:retropepsin-like aspartic protease family protein n=1 Tax=Pseudomonas TaxID=286 RepID=UPI0015F5BFDF|nr:TIGR02281 family clan AA aspartic protease [Pseudomonas sp. 5Ae-yellow]MBA6421217.1 TIGR02281 family clan AA aspartic protease [Pseudomonas sp. 5Ae-yellow]|tara:strand:- start:2382 stop:3059 length:678 start_codon:yes stop_codon:yes gene_type:complete
MPSAATTLLKGAKRLLPAVLLSAVVVGSAWAEPEVRVVGLFANAAVVNVDGQRHMLRVGKPGPDGVTLISADSKSATISINGQRRQYGLQREYTQGFAERETQRVSIARGEGGHFIANGSINGQNVQFMVDTGATSVAMNAIQARRLGIDFLVTGTEVRASTASANVKAYRVRLDRVKVGDIELNGIDGLVLEGRFPTDVLLGMSWLNRVRMDDQGSTLVLERKY